MHLKISAGFYLKDVPGDTVGLTSANIVFGHSGPVPLETMLANVTREIVEWYAAFTDAETANAAIQRYAKAVKTLRLVEKQRAQSGDNSVAQTEHD